ncbi:hypothetical protein ACLM45_03725 [Synechococcus sp. A10-1-5-9]|uniref:hypothetical protein n=1 Tax=Synechococcus sp. A10-1-5-9 TaxID=3392295 RepID=UPI0039E92838
MNASQLSDQGPAHCGSKPKRLAIGIAPLGTVSIGIVPMGVVCIGIVPMGVVSIGVVAMGVINFSIVGMGLLAVGVNTMGVWTAGPMSMGLVRMGAQPGVHDHNAHHGGGGSQSATAGDPRTLAYPTRELAEDQAKNLGCKGAHQMGNFWMPCSEHPKGHH